MNRRKFFLSTASVALVAALPASLAASALAPDRKSKAPLPGWSSLEECRAHCGRSFRASAPVDAELRLERADPAGAGRQFTATFKGPIDAPEGLYRLDSGQGRTDLFLQTVHGKPGTLRAVFNLVD